MDKKIRFDIIGKRNLWFIIALVVIGGGIVSMLTQGLNYGVDFTGGQIIRFEAGREVTTSEVDEIISNHGVKFSPAQILSGGREFTVRIASYGTASDIKKMSDQDRKTKETEYLEKTRQIKIDFNLEFFNIDPENFTLYGLSEIPTKDSIQRSLDKAESDLSIETIEIVSAVEAPRENLDDPVTYNAVLKLGITEPEKAKILVRELYEVMGEGYRQFLQEDKIDPVFGVELKKKAYIALIIATIGILLYVTIRFEFWFAVAAIVALIHDCLITLGFYSVMRLEVNSAFVAIILTVFGYSINDTIVIFDRIRENMRKHKKLPLSKLMNISLWETMPRSINTVLTTEVTIVAIMILGGASIRDFAMGLSVGILSGCYSSILIAAPMAYLLKSGEKAVADMEKAAPGPVNKTTTKKSVKPAAPTEKKSAQETGQTAKPEGDKADGSKKRGKQRRR